MNIEQLMNAPALTETKTAEDIAAIKAKEQEAEEHAKWMTDYLDLPTALHEMRTERMRRLDREERQYGQPWALPPSTNEILERIALALEAIAENTSAVNVSTLL